MTRFEGLLALDNSLSPIEHLGIMPAYPASCRYVFVFLACLAFTLSRTTAARGAEAADLKAKFLAGPMRDVEEIVFAARTILYEHWYANIGYWATDQCRPMYGKRGRL